MSAFGGKADSDQPLAYQSRSSTRLWRRCSSRSSTADISASSAFSHSRHHVSSSASSRILFKDLPVIDPSTRLRGNCIAGAASLRLLVVASNHRSSLQSSRYEAWFILRQSDSLIG